MPKSLTMSSSYHKATKKFNDKFHRNNRNNRERLSNRNFSLGEMVKELLTSMR